MDFTNAFLLNEAQSLQNRLSQLAPFSLTMPMVPAACISDEALKEVTNLLLRGYRELQRRLLQHIHALQQGSSDSAEAIQAKFATLKLRFNALLDQQDIFADVLAQRAEHGTGVWVAGLDVLAADALTLTGRYYTVPPLICFLERGHGAAIRRARTRLPGGEENPVAVIQVPRERMIGSGIASSLVHEVGHQGAALLGLVDTLRENIRQYQSQSPTPEPWELYYRWLSEIIADFWSMAHLGITATIGLINVVSLPRYFMFRINGEDPHPFPWIRVKLSIAFGKILFPGAQWKTLEDTWRSMYPLVGLQEDIAQTIKGLIRILPQFVQLVINHRSAATRMQPLFTLFPVAERQPGLLRQYYRQWISEPERSAQSPPSLVFAAIGQAHADRQIDADTESRLLTRCLRFWALMRSESRTASELGKGFHAFHKINAV